MTTKLHLKKTLEWILVTIPLWGTIGAFTATSMIENNRYNNLTKSEKIEYLQNKLNEGYKSPPAIAYIPKIGGGTLAIWNKQKRELQEELKSLNEIK